VGEKIAEMAVGGVVRVMFVGFFFGFLSAPYCSPVGVNQVTQYSTERAH